MGPNPDRAPTRTGPRPGLGHCGAPFTGGFTGGFTGASRSPQGVPRKPELGPSPGWGPVRVGAIWALMGPYGPIEISKDMTLLKDSVTLMEINEDEDVNHEGREDVIELGMTGVSLGKHIV